MTDFLKMIPLLREQMTAGRWQSDIIKPITLILGMLFVAFLISLLVSEKYPWAPVMLGSLICLLIFLLVFAYVYCLFVDRDSLRSERHSISKLAIEHGVFGDSESGILSIEHEMVNPDTPQIENKNGKSIA